MKKMNPERKQLLVDALRSGKYEQTHGTLRDAEECSFCVLGVACELFRQEAGLGEWTSDGAFRIAKEEETDGLPGVVQDWFGFDGYGGRVCEDSLGDGIDLWELNDNGKTFADLADLIEREL
jgi:hypothetical protein